MSIETAATTSEQIAGNSSRTATTAARPPILFPCAKRHPATPIRKLRLAPSSSAVWSYQHEALASYSKFGCDDWILAACSKKATGDTELPLKQSSSSSRSRPPWGTIGGWFLVVVLRKRLKVSSSITPPVIEDDTPLLSRRLGASWSVSPGFRESSGSVLVRTLIYLKTSSDQRRKFVRALLENESQTIPVL
jgi:hypothetical protein